MPQKRPKEGTNGRGFEIFSACSDFFPRKTGRGRTKCKKKSERALVGRGELAGYGDEVA